MIFNKMSDIQDDASNMATFKSENYLTYSFEQSSRIEDGLGVTKDLQEKVLLYTSIRQNSAIL